jgi:hypothetical protein
VGETIKASQWFGKALDGGGEQQLQPELRERRRGGSWLKTPLLVEKTPMEYTATFPRSAQYMARSAHEHRQWNCFARSKLDHQER